MFFNFFRTPMSVKKYQIGKVLTILGVKFEFTGRAQIQARIAPEKTKKALELINQLAREILQKDVQLKTLQSARGLLRYCTGLVRAAAAHAWVKNLDTWVSGFPAIAKDAVERRKLLITCKRLFGELQNLKPRVWDMWEEPPRVWWLYSDAALGSGGMHIGGLIIDDKGGAKGFTIEIANLPRWLTPNIALLEMIAADEARRFMNDELERRGGAAGVGAWHFIDNMSDAYALIKGVTKDLGVQAVLNVACARGEHFWVGWISTHRNLADPLTRLQKISELRKTLTFGKWEDWEFTYTGRRIRQDKQTYEVFVSQSD